MEFSINSKTGYFVTLRSTTCGSPVIFRQKKDPHILLGMRVVYFYKEIYFFCFEVSAGAVVVGMGAPPFW